MFRSVLLSLVVSNSLCAAEPAQIVLWNAEKVFSTDVVDDRASDFVAFKSEFPDADLIILDEVTSLSVVNAVRDKMGYTGFHTACSDFSQNDNATFTSLEVGFISRFAMTEVTEFDPTTDNTNQPVEPTEEPLHVVDVPGLVPVGVGRGFLTAHIADLNLTIVGTHLKSSNGVNPGNGDHNNARKREFVAAAIARFVSTKLQGTPGITVLLGGDMNVGETDKKKIGHRLTEDAFNAAQGDLYDDTHAIFSSGLVDNLHMASLTKGLGAETYDDPQFAGSGPIDCLYTTGGNTGGFTLATKSKETFGSDHFAVSVNYTPGSTTPTGPVVVPPPPTGIRISALLPNPDGPDVGHETITLLNGGADAIDLNGWKLRDEANNVIVLSGSIAAGATRTIALAEGQLPLNNSGDEIELINAASQQADIVSYTSSQVSSGVEITFGP